MLNSKRQHLLLASGFVLMLVSLGCRGQVSEATPSSGSAGTPVGLTAVPSLWPSPTPRDTTPVSVTSQTPTATLTPTALPPTPDPAWTTYTTPQGVLLEHPTGWTSKVVQDSRVPPRGPLWWGSFKSGGGPYTSVPSYDYVEVKIQPLETFQPPAEVAWERRVTSGPVEGVIQVVGSLKNYEYSDVILDLKATYLHPDDNLKVEIIAKLGDESRNLVRTQGFTTTIEQNFQPFLHMAETIRFGVSPTPTPTRTPTPTPITWATPLLSTPTWATFTFTTPVSASFRYPSDWAVETRTPPSFILRPPQVSIARPVGLNASAFELLRVDRASIDPRRNNGWHEVSWLKPVDLPGIVGFIYVIEEPYMWDAPFLNAKLYSEDYETALTFSTNIRDVDSLLMIETQGITATVAQRFQIFEQIVNSVQLPPLPVPRPTATSIPDPLPQPPVASGWLTTTLSTFTVDYPADWWVITDPIISPATYFSGKFTLPDNFEGEIPSNYAIYFSNAHFVRMGDEEIPSTVADLLPRREAGAFSSFKDPQTGVSTLLVDYEVLWQKQVDNNNLPGIMYVWGKPTYWQSGDPVLLYGIFYDQKNSIDFRLLIVLDEDSVELAQNQGFEAMIGQRFQLFEHMVNSVELNLSE